MSSTSKRSLAVATIRGTIWTFASNYSGKIMVFISTAILARLLSQEDFGVAGYAIVVIGFLEVISDIGVASALIYEEDRPKAADTAFWLGLGTGLAMFALTWWLAPWAGVYFKDGRAVPLTRALAAIFPVTALGATQDALLRKKLHFGRRFGPDVAQSISKGLISIVFAGLGFGAWSLVLGQVGGRLVSAVFYWRVLSLRPGSGQAWRPGFRFSWPIARSLLSYGVGIISVSMLGVFILNVDYLFVGRVLGATLLGVYTLAFRVPELVIKQLYGQLASVIFPIYTKAREDPRLFNQAFLATIRYVTLVTVPLGVGLALVSDPFVRVVFSEKWVDAIPVMRAISIYMLVLSFAFNAGDIYKAQGRLRLLTRLSLVRAVVLVPTLWWAIDATHSITVVGWVQAANAAFASGLNLVVAFRLFAISPATFFASLRPSLIGGAIMSVAVVGTLTSLQNAAAAWQLAASVTAGGLAYLGSLWLLQREEVLQAGSLLRAALVREGSSRIQDNTDIFQSLF